MRLFRVLLSGDLCGFGVIAATLGADGADLERKPGEVQILDVAQNDTMVSVATRRSLRGVRLLHDGEGAHHVNEVPFEYVAIMNVRVAEPRVEVESSLR